MTGPGRDAGPLSPEDIFHHDISHDDIVHEARTDFSLKSYIFFASLLVTTSLFVGCEDTLPTASGPDLIPGSPRSVEVFFDYDEVVRDLRVFSGYGSVSSLDSEILARDVEGVFNSRVLARFRGFPETIQAVDAEGTTRVDSMFTVIGGRVTVRLDTLPIGQDTAAFVAGATTTPWDPGSATWELASDTVGGSTSWPEPGGGPVEVLDTAVWRSVAGVDSVYFDVDSTTMASWMVEEDPARGVRIEIDDPGIRLEASRVNLLLRVRPSFEGTNPTYVSTGSRATTFIYDPQPDPPADGIRFGGAPSWRTVLELEFPETITGPPAVCEVVGCPFQLSSDQLTYAGIQLATRETSSLYSNDDSLAVEVRTVLRPDLLPRSPLGTRPLGGVRLPPDVFGLGSGELVEIPITNYARDLIGDGSETGVAPPNTVALFSPLEPLSYAFGEFYGGGAGVLAPRFRLVLTLADEVNLP